MLNILILSAGRRVELVQAFQKALAAYAPGSIVVAADMQPLSPALYHADDKVLVPAVDHPSYVEELCRVISEHQIELVVPTIDPELSPLAEAREEIQARTGAYIMIAEPWVINITNDKVHTHNYLTARGLLAPGIYNDGTEIEDEKFPIILKPRSGSSSVGVHVVESREALDTLLPSVTAPMLQELARGDEYTVDCFCDFNNNVISVVPRLRISTREGEILQGRIVKDQEIIHAVKKLLHSLPMPGHSTVQCFKTERGVEFIEVNPRFGGGAPMSIAAGADSCANLVRLLQGVSIPYEENYEDGLTFLRYDQAVMLRDNAMLRERLRSG